MFDQRPLRPRDDRQAVAALAWNYWCNQFAKTKEDRTTAVDHLRRLLDPKYGLDSKANRNTVADMEETLAKRDVEAGSLEAAVESLRDLDVDGQWPGCGYQHFNNYTDRDANFKRLHDSGLAAVPTLISHLHDYRLTRCIETSSGGRYAWHVRIADVVAVLLNGLNPNSFSYRFAQLVNDTDDDRAWEAFEKAAKRVDIGQRLEMIQGIANCSEQRRGKVTVVLAKFLDDEEFRTTSREPEFREGEDPRKAFDRMRGDLFFGPSAGFIHPRLSVRDFVALQLAHKLDSTSSVSPLATVSPDLSSTRRRLGRSDCCSIGSREPSPTIASGVIRKYRRVR